MREWIAIVNLFTHMYGIERWERSFSICHLTPKEEDSLILYLLLRPVHVIAGRDN